MKKTFMLLVLLGCGCSLGYAQTSDRPPSTDNPAQRQASEPSYAHNWGWVGLFGLAGLAGLRRRKSEDVRRLEATGIAVKTVKTA